VSPVDLSHILFQLGEERAQYSGAIAPPVFQTSNFAMPNVAAMRTAIAGEYDTALYTRGANPTAAVLRAKLAALEGTEDALVFGSGSAAVAAAVMASVGQGDHVVCVDKPYSWTRALLRDLLPRFGVACDFVDARDPSVVALALRPATRLIVLESPNSMTFEQQDLAAISAIARPRGIRTMIDNSWASPLGQNPAAFGIDVVVHSGTKYIAGHSDVVFGAVCGSRAFCESVFRGPYMTLGAILSPHDAWLALRGLRTLEVRMHRISDSTTRVLAFLSTHRCVRRVFHPYAAEHAQHAITTSQLRFPSGVLSIELESDLDGVERFVDGLRRFLIAVSWGGYESLVFPAAAWRDWRGREQECPVPVTLVRLSIGLEDPEVLIADLAQALERI
jgi:cystathionine beta-lyase/cystathionine gamma-synthase